MIKILVALVAGLLTTYLVLLAVLLARRPQGNLLREALRLLPDLLRFIPRLAADRRVPPAARLRLWLVMAYLAVPFDLVPDFIPVLGYADDAIIVSVVLRGVLRRAGADAVRRNWPGSDAGLASLSQLCGLEPHRRPA
jgi:uncharacterized membrane protein YkvA (DUF1232 family)